jgi:hypothetical protein
MKAIRVSLLLLAVAGLALAAASAAPQAPPAGGTAVQADPQTKPQAAPPAKPASKPPVKKERTETIVPGPKDIKELWAIRVFLPFLWLVIIYLLFILRWKIREADRVYQAKFYAVKDRSGESARRPSAGDGIPAGPSAL